MRPTATSAVLPPRSSASPAWTSPTRPGTAALSRSTSPTLSGVPPRPETDSSRSFECLVRSFSTNSRPARGRPPEAAAAEPAGTRRPQEPASPIPPRVRSPRWRSQRSLTRGFWTRIVVFGASLLIYAWGIRLMARAQHRRRPWHCSLLPPDPLQRRRAHGDCRTPAAPPIEVVPLGRVGAANHSRPAVNSGQPRTATPQVNLPVRWQAYRLDFAYNDEVTGSSPVTPTSHTRKSWPARRSSIPTG